MTDFGKTMEEEAARYLETVRGWCVLARRARFREGEIDLVMETPEGELRFVEVKARRSEEFGEPLESITPLKLKRLRRAVSRWREKSGNRRPGQLYFLGFRVAPSGRLTLEEYFLD